MIRINLLPFRAVRKKESIQKQIIIYFVSVIIVLAPLIWYQGKLKQQIEDLGSRITDTEKELKRQEKKAKEVDKYTKLLNDLKKKMEIVKTLEEGRRATFDLLLDLTDVMVPAKMWFQSLRIRETEKREKKDRFIIVEVSISGIAMDDKTVATYMESLQKLDRFAGVTLNVSETVKVNKELELKQFRLECREKPVPFSVE